MPTNIRRTKLGFTLIELLVVIAIIAILAAILFPVFQTVRENARRTQGLSNAKQLGLAIVQYYQDTDEAMPMAGHSQFNGDPRTRQAEWQNAIYPFVKSDAVYKDPDDSVPTGGQPVQDPSIIDPAGGGAFGKISATSFIMGYYETNGPNLGAGGNYATPHILADFTTPAQFILLREGQRGSAGGSVSKPYTAPDHNGNVQTSWQGTYAETSPNDAELMFNECNNNNIAAAGLPYHKAGEIFEFLDGHVKFVAMDVKNPVAYLNAQYPPCKYTRPNGDDPSCSVATPPAGFVPIWQAQDSAGCTL